jgi:hypothetical protein
LRTAVLFTMVFGLTDDFLVVLVLNIIFLFYFRHLSISKYQRFSVVNKNRRKHYLAYTYDY